MLKESNSGTKVSIKTQTHGDVYQGMYVVLTNTVFVTTVIAFLYIVTQECQSRTRNS